ncbi:CDP-diacylglycerol--serine O-phosphatidyltransferase [Mycobacterium tuberculosis]|nr:CDP-diacylglycerol--serine O-phosphatidyltransferase [Mycobacterium tuberculosis]
MIGKPRGRRGVNLQILPSAMTVLSICAGLTAIKFALEHQPKAAMALIAAAAILDGLDGRVARILDAQSRMGAEIDSLADAVNFGVTPALVLYVSMLSKWPVGWVVVLLYAGAWYYGWRGTTHCRTTDPSPPTRMNSSSECPRRRARFP